MGELVTGDGVGEASGDLSLHLRLSFAYWGVWFCIRVYGDV